jgi:hypothetical protein
VAKRLAIPLMPIMTLTCRCNRPKVQVEIVPRTPVVKERKVNGTLSELAGHAEREAGAQQRPLSEVRENVQDRANPNLSTSTNTEKHFSL